MKPGMQAALQMRSSAELQEFVKMRDIPQLKDQADEILKLMMRAGREAKRNIENVDQLLADFRSPEAITYAKAAIELKGHGPYAVPYVVGMLALDKPEEQRGRRPRRRPAGRPASGRRPAALPGADRHGQLAGAPARGRRPGPAQGRRAPCPP